MEIKKVLVIKVILKLFLMIIVNMTYFKKNGKILTPGKIKIKKGTKVTYKNKAGSRGKVTLEGDTLTWKNTYTGNNYKIIVKKNN